MSSILILASHHSNERKHGLYPTAVKYHHKLGLECFLYLISTPETLGPYAETGAKILLKGKTNRASLPKVDLFLFASVRFRQDLSMIRQHIAEAGKPELILALNSSPIAGTVAYLAGREHDVPFVVWEHLTHYQRKILRGFRLKRRINIMTAATSVLAVSESLSESIQSTLDISNEKFSIMPNPIPIDFIGTLPPVSEKYKNLRTANFTFGAWTNWRRIKRLDLLLEAFSIVRKEYPDTSLVLAGPIGKNVYSKINSKFMSQPGLVRLGSIPRDEVVDIARIVDCCVIPSDHETFGLPALEAIAMGRPVITTRCGGPEHLVTPTNGIVVDKGSAHALAEAMIDMIHNHKNYNCKHIANSARADFGPSKMQWRWEQFYRKLGLLGL